MRCRSTCKRSACARTSPQVLLPRPATSPQTRPPAVTVGITLARRSVQGDASLALAGGCAALIRPTTRVARSIERNQSAPGALGTQGEAHVPELRRRFCCLAPLPRSPAPPLQTRPPAVTVGITRAPSLRSRRCFPRPCRRMRCAYPPYDSGDAEHRTKPGRTGRVGYISEAHVPEPCPRRCHLAPARRPKPDRPPQSSASRGACRSVQGDASLVLAGGCAALIRPTTRVTLRIEQRRRAPGA
jgi:hypothetical protein